MAPHSSDRHTGGPSLEQLLALMPPGMIETAVAPHGTGGPVADVVLHDPGEDRGDAWAASGLILLAIGVEAGSADAEDVWRAADRAGAAAVVLRRGARGPRAALTAAVREGRTALLTRQPGQGWTEVLGQLRTALAHSAAPGANAVDGLRLGDLPGLANTVAELVGGAITIEDPQSRVLAYSRMDHEPDPMRRLTILGQQVPRWRVDELRESGFFQTLWATDDVVRRPADERSAERLAIAVRHGAEVLGSLWAAADGRPLAEGAAAALRVAARAAVPHLSHHLTWGREVARAREGAVRALLDGSTHPVRDAHAAGIAPDRPYAVLVAEAAGAPAPGDDAGGQRVLDVLALQADAFRPGCVSARGGRRLYVLVPASDGETDPARTLLASARSLPRGAVLAGTGPVAADLSALPASRESAELVVRVLRERGAHGPAGHRISAVAGHQEVVAETSVLRLLDRVEPVWESLPGPVHALIAHDRAHGAAYGRTVAAYLDAFGDTALAARRLNVHPNTLRYRLRRVRELFGLDLAGRDARLLAAVGLRIAARGPRPSPPA